MPRLLISLFAVPLIAQQKAPIQETSPVPITFQGQWVDTQCNVYGFSQKASKLEIILPEMNNIFTKWELPAATLATITDGVTFSGDLKSSPAVHLEGTWRGGWIEMEIKVENDSRDLALIPRDDPAAKGCKGTPGKAFPSSIEVRTSAASTSLGDKIGIAVYLKDREGKFTAAQKDIVVKLSAPGTELRAPEIVMHKGAFFGATFAKLNNARWEKVTAQSSGIGKADEGFCGCDLNNPQAVSRLSLTGHADAIVGESTPVYIRFFNARNECIDNGMEKTLKTFKFGPGDFVTPPPTVAKGVCALRSEYKSDATGEATVRVTYNSPNGDLTDNLIIQWHYPNSILLYAIAGLGGLIGMILRKFSAHSKLYPINVVAEGLIGVLAGVGFWFLFYVGFRRASIGWALVVGIAAGYVVKILPEMLKRMASSAGNPKAA